MVTGDGVITVPSCVSGSNVVNNELAALNKSLIVIPFKSKVSSIFGGEDSRIYEEYPELSRSSKMFAMFLNSLYHYDPAFSGMTGLYQGNFNQLS